MRKILLAIDSRQASWPALDFACYLGKLTRSPVTGVFLHQLTDRDAGPASGVSDDAYLTDYNVRQFADACCRRELAVRIHRDKGDPAATLFIETKAADVLVVDPELSFNKRIEGSLTTFVKDVIRHTACPVLITPQRQSPPKEIIFTSNGTASSMLSIKQLTYLFPEWHPIPVRVIQVNKNGTPDYEEEYHLKEWLSRHYQQLSFETVKGDSGMRFFEQLSGYTDSLLVLGAFGRTALSRLFKRSHAKQLIATLRQPVFIAYYEGIEEKAVEENESLFATV
jgi:nucleotide-binding universal stress UspA family protein